MVDCSSHRISFVFPSFAPLPVVLVRSVSSFQTSNVVLIRLAFGPLVVVIRELFICQVFFH